MPAAWDWSPLLPQGILQLWWVTRKAEPLNQTQVPSQARRDLAETAMLVGLMVTMPHKHTDFFCETELKSQILAWNKLQTLPSVPAHPPTLSHYAIPGPVPMPALPRSQLCPAQKVVSSWAKGDQGLLYVSNHNEGMPCPSSSI